VGARIDLKRAARVAEDDGAVGLHGALFADSAPAPAKKARGASASKKAAPTAPAAPTSSPTAGATAG
jgi:hypothetical protein